MAAKRKVSAPATRKRPKTRRDAAMPHYDEPADVRASVLHQVAQMRRCVITKDGTATSNQRRWLEINRDRSVLLVASGTMEFLTEDGRRWMISVQEMPHG